MSKQATAVGLRIHHIFYGRMSIHHMSRVWEDYSVVSRAHLLVLLAIADYARSDGKAWPSIDSLAKKARLSQRGVQDAISALVLQKRLEVEVGSGPSGTNVYRLIEGGAATAPPQMDAGIVSGKSAGISDGYLHPIRQEPSGTPRNGKEGVNNGTRLHSTSTVGRLYGIPESVEQVISYGKSITPKVDEDRCRSFWAHYEGQARENTNGEKFWVTSGEAVITNWKAKLPGWKGSDIANRKSRNAGDDYFSPIECGG